MLVHGITTHFINILFTYSFSIKISLLFHLFFPLFIVFMSIQSYGKNDFHMQNLYIPRAPVRKVSNKYMYLINIILKENHFERRCRKDCPCIYTLTIMIQSKWNRVSCEEKIYHSRF